MHEHPLEHGELEQRARRRIVRLGYDPGDLDSLRLRYLINATEVLGLPAPHLLATLAILHHDLPRAPTPDDEPQRCIICHQRIRPQGLWLIDDTHPVHRHCRPIDSSEWDAIG